MAKSSNASETAGAAATAAAEAPARKFSYNGHELVDIDPTMMPEQIRDIWAGTYPELQNAKIKGPDVKREADGTEVKSYTFTRNVGHLG